MAHGTVFNGVYADTNYQILPGFTLLSSQVTGVVTNTGTNVPTLVQFTAGTNTVATNATLALTNQWTLLTNRFTAGTNTVATNAAAALLNATNVLQTNINTGLITYSNALFTNLSYSLTLASNLFQTNWISVSNNVYTLLTYNLTTASNALFSSIVSNSVSVATVSNSVVVASNALVARITASTNGIFNFTNGLIGKAFTATLPATYASIGIGFSTPLMPDGNYSVSLTPQDQNTADAQAAGLHWWVGSKNNSGFTLSADYSTNAYNLNFDCTIKENTQ